MKHAQRICPLSLALVMILAFVAMTLAVPGATMAQNIRGSTTGPTTAKGYDHPDQFVHLKDVKPAENMYPVIPHPEQEQQARDKLAALEKKFGKKPNIVIFLLDDVGWMDPGFNGGGIAVGNETPAMDKLASGGLVLTSLLDALLLPESRHHPYRTEPAPPRHPAPAHVRRARRSGWRDHDALAPEEAGLCHAGCGQVAHG